MNRALASLLLLSSVAVVSVSVSRPAHAYRTAKDLPELSGSDIVRWSSHSVPYRLHIGAPSGLSYASVELLTRQSLETWSKPDCSGVVFSFDGPTTVGAVADDGVNTIQWVTDGWWQRGFDATQAAVTDITYIKDADGNWSIGEADLYLNAIDHSWALSTEDESVRDVGGVMTHEGGHMLGILHPCELDGSEGAPLCSSSSGYAETTMYPVYSAEQRTLATDDEAAVCFLYEGKSCDVTGCSSYEVCTPSGCRLPCGTTTCERSEVCEDEACVTPPCAGVDCAFRCSSEEDCPDGWACDKALTDNGTETSDETEPEVGTCVTGSGSLGDPCTVDTDCSTAGCHPDGYCTTRCTDNADCSLNGTCESVSTSLSSSTCALAKAPFGARCMSGDDCITGQCLDGATDDPVCTRRCGPDQTPCPFDWDCKQIDGRDVCAPPPQSDGCSCRVPGATASRRQHTGLWTLALFALAVSFAARRRSSDTARRVGRPRLVHMSGARQQLSSRPGYLAATKRTR